MNIVNPLVRLLKGSRGTNEGEEGQFLIRLKEADDTNTVLERNIIECADGSSVAEISRRISTGDPVWTAWIQKWTGEALQSLEQRGFIRIEKRPKSPRSCN